MKRVALLAAGWLLLALGTVGIFVPVLPTTPLVLAAGGCFSFASPRIYQILRRSRWFGPYLEHARTGGGIPLRDKVRSIVCLWLLLAISTLAMRKVWATVLFVVVGIAVTLHLALIKTRPEKEAVEADSADELA